jgi:drug/metabolite transporter (DMT)-like permease
MSYLGETAALLTAGCWTCTSMLFSFAVRRLGSFRLNLIRLTLAAAILWVVALIAWGTGWLHQAHAHELRLLALSGWIGLTLGDWAYFHSLDMLGPRIGTLLITLTPPMTVALGATFLGEHPGPLGVAGMVLTLAGVAWVVLERTGAGTPVGHRIRGASLGLLSSLATAVAYILSKSGMAGGINPLQASALRMAAATAAMWAITAVARRDSGYVRLTSDRRLFAATTIGIVLGPVTGIWLSLVAVHHTQAGIAATLISTVPVFVLPVVAVVHKERLTWRAVLGAIVAVAGVALLFWRR